MIRCAEEEIGLIPEFAYKVDAAFYHAYRELHIFGREPFGFMGGQHGHEEACHFLIGEAHDVFMIEPCSLLVIEFGAGFRAMFKREFFYQIVHGHQLGIVARIPSEKREEIDYGLRQIAAFAVA